MHAPAKLNLNLHILGKLDNGYHELQSLVAFAEIFDELSCAESEPRQNFLLSHHYDDVDVTLHVNTAHTLDNAFIANNLVYQAAKQLHTYALDYNAGTPCSTHMTLEKNIPIGAGLGGGSSDAATALRLLNEHWQLNLPESKLAEFAALIGSDIAACLTPKTQWMAGTGNKLTAADIAADLWAVIIHPKTPLSSAKVYENLKHDSSTMQPAKQFAEFQCNSSEQLLDYLKHTENHLTNAAIRCEPVIADVLSALERLPNIALTRMSGSGSACFGLFKAQQDAKIATKQLQQQRPEWWSTAARLIL